VIAQLSQTPLGVRDPDHGHRQRAALHHPVERREDHLVGQIAGRTEEHECIGRSRPSLVSHPQHLESPGCEDR